MPHEVLIGDASTSAEKPKLSKVELERGQQDIQAVNNDLKLLSTLLGRPIGVDDLPSITSQFGKTPSGGSTRGSPPRRAPTTTTTTTSTTTPTPRTTTRSDNTADAELLQRLLQQQNGLRDENRPEYYGKTDDAILATILKQQGIGPSHNNLPIDVSIGAGLSYADGGG